MEQETLEVLLVHPQSASGALVPRQVMNDLGVKLPGKKVRFIIASQDKLGRWVTTEPLETRGMKFDKHIETRIFISHIKTLSEYLNLLR